MARPSITGTTASTATTAQVGLEIRGLGRYTDLRIEATLAGATGGTLDVYLQVSNDGTTWTDYAHFPQLAAGASSTKYTFAVSRRAQQLNFVTIGTNLSPALAANSIVGGDFGDRMRCVCVSGAGTSVGAALAIYINQTIMA